MAAGPTAGRGILAASAALAALSLLAPHAPGYDPWAWLIWGREVAQGGLDTVDGPAFKPLPVLIDAGLWRLGGDGLAPTAWLWVARTGAIAGAGLAGLLAFRLAGGSRAAGVLAALGVALTAGSAWHAAVGNAEGLAFALAVAATGCALDGRPRAALTAGLALALLRPESWVLLLAYGLWAARRDRGLRAGLAAGTAAVLAAWFVPEWLGSGDPLRSGARAIVPNPGQPATAALPGWAALRAAIALPLAPLALLALAAPGRARIPAALGVVWIVEVAVMAQVLGTSGEPRYSLPGAAGLAVSGAAGAIALVAGTPAALSRRLVAGAVAVALLTAVALRLPDTRGELARSGDAAELARSLPVAVAAAGGRERVLACGRPVTGRYRGPLVAWTLAVPRRVVVTPAGRAGVVLRSQIRRGAALQPAAPVPGRPLARSGRWVIVSPCA